MAEPTTDIIPVTNGEPSPELPPPVEPPEYYAGFAAEFEQIGVELQDAYRRLQTAEQKLAQPLSIQAVGGLGGFGEFMRTGLKLSPLTYIIEALIPGETKQEAMKVLAAEVAAEFDAAARDFQMSEWKLEIMQVMPVYLSDPFYVIEKPEDILQYVAPGMDMTDADTAWLRQAYDKLSRLSNVLPEDYQGDVLDAQSKIINEILTEPKVELKGVHRLTVDEIAKAFTFGVTEFPPGLSAEDVRGIMSEIGVYDEEMKSEQEWLAERAREWELEAARMNLIRAGTILAETPELTPLQWAKLIVTQPMMATVEVMQKWWDTISRPISAAITMNLPAPAAGAVHGVALGAAVGGTIGTIVPGLGTAIGAGIGALVGAIGGAGMFAAFMTDADKELTVHYEFYREQGESAWSSYAKAFNEWDAPWWKKMILDSAYDPLMWIGWGGIAAVGNKLTRIALPRGLKWAGSRIGNLMVAFEQGYVAGADAIFRAGIKVVAAPIKSAFWLTGAGYTIPATFTQMSRNFGKQGAMDFFAVVGRTYKDIRGKFGVGMTGKDANEVVEASVRAALKNPEQGTSPLVRLGTSAMEFNYLDDVAAAKFMKEVAGDVMFDTPRLAKFNSRLADAFSVHVPATGEPINRIVAGGIFEDLIIEPTTKQVATLATKIGKFKEGVAKTAIEALKGDTADQVIKNIYNHLQLSRYDNLHSPLTKWMQQAGRSSSWHSRVADKILYSSRLVALERWAVMPIARWQLLFTNFGPFNFLENSGRSFLGGAEIMYPKAYGGVDEALRVFRGLANTDYELIMAQRGIRRMTQAVVDPKTGVTAVFKGGKVPLVTTRMRIPEKIPRWGGKYIGKTINIGDKNYFLGSAQDWYDMWADLTMKQNAYDLQVHFLRSLEDIAPDDMVAIHKVMDKTKPMLDDVISITKREASDITREMELEIIGGGPESVRAFADVDVITMQRRMLNMRLNRDTMDKMTDIHGVIKRGVNDEVLDGTMFTKGHAGIDERMDAFVSASRELDIASLAPQMDSIKDDVAGLIANPPRNLDDFMGDMQQITSHVEAVRETIHDYRRISRLRAAKLFGSEADDFAVGEAKMLAEYMDVAEDELVRMMNQVMENARAIPKFSTGYRVGTVRSTTGFMASEGEGLYITKEKGLAQFFRQPERVGLKNVRSVRYTQPRNPLKTTDELFVLDESANIYKPILSTDSPWTRINKQAARNVGITDETWSAKLDDLTSEISKLARAEGYDAIDAGEWWVLIDESLWKNLPEEGKAILSEVQLARLTDLDSISRLELDNILAARTKLASVEAEIPAFHKSIRKVWRSDPEGAATRSKRFWDSQKSRKADIWDEFDGIADKFKADRLLTSRNFLTSVDKTVYVPDFVPDVVGELTPNHLAYLYGCTGDDLYRGLTRIHRNTRTRPRGDFIIHTRDQANAYAAKFGKTADQIGFTDEAIGEVYDQMWKNLGVDPSILTPDHPTMLQMEEIRQEVHRLYDATKIPESDVIKWRKYINGVADEAEQLGAYKVAAPPRVPPTAEGFGGTPDWWAKKEQAMTKAKEMHYMAYPNYEEANIIDETMRAIFPFWNYELFRWKWLPRTFLRTPGVMSALGRYMNYTDQGYNPVPGTDLQINILRGTVFMGGLRSFYLRDFPEFHDAAPGIEFLDYIGRAGFFPGVHVMLPIILFGAGDEPPQFGQLAPAWVKTGLSALRALSPEHIGNILEYIYPDRFRDYMAMMQLGAMGYDADEIWNKKQQGIKLTEEEEKLWLQAVNKVDGVKGILMNQTGLFRIRPDEFTQIRKEMRAAIEEATGVPVRTQDWIDKMYPVTGKRFSDYFHLDELQQALLYQWESFRRYRGITTPLYPSSWQAVDIKRNDYYNELERVYNDVRYLGRYDDEGNLLQPSIVDINRQLVEGVIGPSQWKSIRNDIQDGLSEAVRILGDSPAYKDVPKTFEEMAVMLEERGIVIPTKTPDQELLHYYFELKPELKYNWESNRMELDYETYYAYIDILLESLTPPFRERLLNRIQMDWTPMERLYWEFSRTYARPYRNIRDIVLREYTDEQVQIIRRFEVARGTERTDILEVMDADGKLISGYQKRLREARQRLRILDPELDAWLYFFGTTDKWMSHESEEIYNNLTKQYLVPAMIGEAK